MSSVINLHSQAKTDQAQALKASLDAGGAACIIDIYTGAIGDVGNSTKLASLAAHYPSGTVAQGKLTFGAIQNSIALASGIAAWAQFKTSDGTPVCDVNVSSTGGTAFMRLNSTSIVKDGPVSITSCVFEF